MNTRIPALVLTLQVLWMPLQAAVQPAPLFAEGAVLQRDKPLPVWGAADPGEKVSVEFAGRSATTTADAEGRWRVTLDPLPASSDPRELTIRGDNTVVIRDVVVGEVWLASGQSNMEWPVAYTNEKSLIASTHLPLVRQFKVERAASFKPETTLKGAWTSAVPAHVGQFSAVGFYFAADLHQKLNVPVAILNSSWGGTAIEPWIAPDAYRATPEIARVLAKSEKGPRASDDVKAAYEAELAAWEKARADAKANRESFSEPAPKRPKGLPGNRTPGGLYNAMVHPFVRYALRGAIWYQGESNAGHAAQYPVRFAALITGWRAQFDQGDFPFYWVQLPNFDHGGKNDTHFGWALLREAQTKTLSVPNTGQAVTIDVGDPKELHPKNKRPVGERLARLALARTYGQRDVIDSGPALVEARREGAHWRAAFDPATGPLKSGPDGLTGFELAGDDKIFHPAEARIDGHTVIVHSPAVPEPIALRYAFRNAPASGLLNNEGLPSVPFRTDSW